MRKTLRENWLAYWEGFRGLFGQEWFSIFVLSSREKNMALSHFTFLLSMDACKHYKESTGYI